MDKETAIEVSELKKKYKLGSIGGGTLKGEIQSKRALKKGLADPNSKIGSTYEYGKEFYALDGIDFSVKKGEALGIIGHNGAGKSTLLKVLSRITAPTQGQVSIRGRISSMLEVGTGFHGELTGRENIYLNAAILGMKKKEVDQKIEKIIDFSECGAFIDTPVKRYSSGMYVKLAFAVAAHLDSEILIMDEVLAVGDVRFQDKCLKKMNHIAKKEGRTILYVSHNMNTIKRLCSRCIVLDHGKKVYDGDVHKAVALYLGNGKDLVENNFDNVNGITDRLVAKLLSLKVLESSDNNDFAQGDTIKIRIGIRAYDSIRGAHIRFIVKYLDSSIAGTYFTEKFDLQNNKKVYIDFDMKLFSIPEGEFYVQAVLSKSDTNGLFEDYSSVESALQFTVRPDINNYAGMRWRRSWNVNLGTLPVVKYFCNGVEENL